MFEVTADDIKLLGDDDLRELVGRLCESDLRSRGIVPSCVTYGGHLKAGDGGIDVRVTLPCGVEPQGFIPRACTGFQVKADDTPASKIASEMRPGGTLRPSIKELAVRSGAYIMVSSKGSVADLPLESRRRAMRNALTDLPNGAGLALDFYDRRRLETWLRNHTGATLWVRQKIGKSISGWQPFGDWSQVLGSADADYLLDDELRMRTGNQATAPGLTVLDGIRMIRDRLREPRGAVRLVGLSGVGKTRLAQALFDPRVGENSLDPDLAAYTDVAKGPGPDANAVASDLVASQKKAILVVDNCRPELHRQLADACKSAESKLSLISIEYDVQDDVPEGTDVFTLGPGSIDLTEKLTRMRFPRLSQLDLRRIADYSGGNARIALALASAISKDDDIATLTDADLLRRLFQQVRGSDPSLLSAAEALSLVYSFDGEDVSDAGQLALIGRMIGKTAQEMFAATAELRRRDLVQERGKWRAVLPQGIANKLATLALENIPRSVVESHLVENGSEHLVKSFSRRLSFLSASEQAKRIVKDWLSPKGLLKDFPVFDELTHKVFQNVSPIMPEVTLATIERAVLRTTDSGKLAQCQRYLHLLRSLAYDAALFERCMVLIVRIVESSGADGHRDEGAKLVASLFSVHFSGTHASIEQRVAVTASLLSSSVSQRRALGLEALKSLLETTHFGPRWDFDFGTHSRDYGYAPKTREDIKNWFRLALQLAKEEARSGGPIAEEVRGVLAGKFRGLWSAAQLHDDLERVFRQVSAGTFWSDGWLAVRQTIRFDAKGSLPESAERLQALELALRPQGLIDQVRAVVLGRDLDFAGMDSEDDKNPDDVAFTMSRIAGRAEELGRIVAANGVVLGELLPALLAGQGHLWDFGRGVAQSAEDPLGLWSVMLRVLDCVPSSARRPEILGGFLNGLREKDSTLTHSLLDDAVESELLAPFYPWLQKQVQIDEKGVRRLLRSLELGKTPIHCYRELVGGGTTHTIPGGDFNALLRGIAARPNGWSIAVEILCMRISYAVGQSSREELDDIGCELVRELKFERGNAIDEYRLGIVVRRCLDGEKGAATVRELCRKFKAAVANSETYAFYQKNLLSLIFGIHPLVALDSLCGGDQAEVYLGLSILEQADLLQNSALDAVPGGDLLGWCARQPKDRFVVVASGITAFRWSDDNRRQEWTEIARRLLARAPDRVAVAKKFLSKFSPTSWSGSRAAIIERNLRLLDDLAEYDDPALNAFIAEMRPRFEITARGEADLEAWIFRNQDEGFE